MDAGSQNTNEGATVTLNGQVSTVTLRGSLGIVHAATLRTQLRQALDHHGAIELDGAAVTRADTAALQILWNFTREAARQQRALRWAAVSPALRGAADSLDMTRSLGFPETSM